MSALRLTVSVEKLEFAAPFRITGFVFEHQDAVVVTLDDGRHRGGGEASGGVYLGGLGARVGAAERSVLQRGIALGAPQRLFPPGGARNALHCALWELEPLRAGRPVWA